MKKVIIVQGPTASGKTDLAIALAKHLNTEIISADSRQFYHEMSIGTAKPDVLELSKVKHHFIDCASVTEEITAATFAKTAKPILNKLLEKTKFAVIVGGSGLFVDALSIGLDDIPVNEKIKNKIIEEYKRNGLLPLLEELKKMDPIYYEIVDKNNAVRVIRAIEVIRCSDKKMSELQSNSKFHERDFEIIRFAINWPRELLYNRINNRVDLMVKDGLFVEVESLIKYRNFTSLNTVGYKEVFDFLDHRISKDESINLIKQHTRNYAKRQMTWLRRYSNIHYLNPLSEETLIQQALRNIDDAKIVE